MKINSSAFAFFPTKEIKFLPKHKRWRKVAKILKTSKEAGDILKWRFEQKS